MYKESDEENMKNTTQNAMQQSNTAQYVTTDPQLRLDVQIVIVWTKHTTYKHKASALRGSYLGPSVNSTAQNESIKRALRWFLFI